MNNEQTPGNDQATARHITHAGATLYYWLDGPPSAPVLVFTHGATADHAMFDEQVAAFHETYRTLTWDVRGHGLSGPVDDTFTMSQAAADLVAILQAENIQRAVFVGQSMGGYIHQYLYRDYPDVFQAMVVIGSTQVAAPYSRLSMWALKVSLPLIMAMPYGLFKSLTVRTTALDPDVRAYMRRSMDVIPPDDFRAIWGGVQGAITTEGIPGFTIDVPLLLTHGDKDRTGSIRGQMPEWARSEPTSTFVIIPNAAHNANQDNAPFFNDLLRDWLADVLLC